MRLFGRKAGGTWRRGAVDFLVALALFWGGAILLGGSHNHALAVPLHAMGKAARLSSTEITVPARLAVTAPARTASERADHRRTMALLSVTFAALVALNLAFWRHLRRVYASPRRGVWRRG